MIFDTLRVEIESLRSYRSVADDAHEGVYVTQRVTKKKSEPTTTKPEVAEEKATPSKAELKKEIDDLLDEIDGVLEHNAEEFVKGYVQKGGE